YQAQYSGRETLPEGEHGSLVNPIHPLKCYPHDFAMSLITHEKLSVERPHLPLVVITQDARCGYTQNRMGKPYRWGFDAFNTFRYFKHRFSGIRNISLFQTNIRLRLTRPFQTTGVSHKVILCNMGNVARAYPMSLVFRIEEITCIVERHSGRRPEACRKWRHIEFGRKFKHPAMPF